MSLGYSFPGLAASTGTRVDSAAKHTLACRVSEPLMMTWCDSSNPRNQLHTQKMKYCMHKNDLVLNCSQPLNDGSTIVASTKAYPSVVSNLGDMTTSTKAILQYLYHKGNTGSSFLSQKEQIHKAVASRNKEILTKMGYMDSDDFTRVSCELKDLPFFTAQGYSLGTAYASQLSGDTVGSVLIGGMQTVMNGAFEMKAGQVVQWYFDFETDCFHDKTIEKTVAGKKRFVWSGMRKLQNPDGKENNFDMNKQPTSEMDKRRKIFHERELGDTNSFPKNYQKKNIFYPKAYMLDVDGNDIYADKIRIFAKCITGARPYEMVDIMMMTQSL